MNRLLFFLSILSALVAQPSTAQPRKNAIDSLEQLLQKQNSDSEKVRTLNTLGWYCIMQGDFLRSITFSTEAITLSEKHHSPYFKGGKGAGLSDIGLACEYMGNYPRALDHFFKALRIAEDIKDPDGLSHVYANIGNVYQSQGDTTNELVYYLKALKVDESSSYSDNLASDLGNLGVAYSDAKQFRKAIDYFERTRVIAEKTGNKQIQAIALGNIGEAWISLGEYGKAMLFLQNAYRIDSASGDAGGMAIRLGDMGDAYFHLKRYKDAERSYSLSLQLDSATHFLEHSKVVLQRLSNLFDSIHQPVTAYFYFKKYISARDSLFNEANTKKSVQSQMQYEFDKKEAVQNAEQEKKDALAAAEHRKQTIILWSVVIGLLLVSAFAVMIYRGFLEKKKANEKISHQKEIIEEKQKDILDSIHYAKRIQRSRLPSEYYIHRQLAKRKTA